MVKLLVKDINNVTNKDLGHRSRLIRKFLDNSSNFSKTEIIELILFIAIPRKDTKPLAKKLIKSYNNSLLDLFSSSEEKLLNIDGIGSNTILMLRLIYKLSIELSVEKIQQKDILKSFTELIEYCRLQMSNKKSEELRVIFLNAKNYIIKDEILFNGTINSVSVHPREILKRCLDLGSTSIVLVHNHPSGDPAPSNEDIELTKNIFTILKQIDIILIDHIIISGNNFVSFKHNNIAPFKSCA